MLKAIEHQTYRNQTVKKLDHKPQAMVDQGDTNIHPHPKHTAETDTILPQYTTKLPPKPKQNPCCYTIHPGKFHTTASNHQE